MLLKDYIKNIIFELKEVQELIKQPMEINFNLKTRPFKILDPENGYKGAWFIEVGGSVESFPNIISFTIVNPYRE